MENNAPSLSSSSSAESKPIVSLTRLPGEIDPVLISSYLTFDDVLRIGEVAKDLSSLSFSTYGCRWNNTLALSKPDDEYEDEDDDDEAVANIIMSLLNRHQSLQALYIRTPLVVPGEESLKVHIMKPDCSFSYILYILPPSIYYL